MGNGEWSVYPNFIFAQNPTFLYIVLEQTHEVIGSPPNVAVPTHFAKVVLASKPSSPSTPDISEISTGAFVLPNAVISDETPLESFVMPGE
jgi:endonuclease G, mitochondrial